MNLSIHTYGQAETGINKMNMKPLRDFKCPAHIITKYYQLYNIGITEVYLSREAWKPGCVLGDCLSRSTYID